MKKLFILLVLAFCLNINLQAQTDSIQKVYYKDGKLQKETPYTNGQRNGAAKGYYENGKLKSDTPFTNGKINGVSKEYYKSGKLKSETPFTDGKEGEMKQYDEDGKLVQ